jgi:secreted trypsin-like serine protease
VSRRRRRRARALAALILGLAALPACDALDLARDDREDNGGDETKYRSGVGMLTGNGSMCSGTLVRADRVLTAAHCADAFVTFTVRTPQGVPYTREVTDGEVNLSYDATPGAEHDARNVGSDAALLQLASALPTEFAPPTLSSTELAAGEPLEVVGYGRSSETANDAGTKRQVTAETVTVFGVETAFTFDNAAGEAVACPGDSGGAVFAWRDGKLEIVGVISARTPGCKLGYAADVYWLEGWLAEAHLTLDGR